MQSIDAITAREVRDSRGNPTIEVVMRSGAVEVSAKVPSGKSAGSREALELRDEDGKGVSHAIANVNGVIASALLHQPLDLSAIDAVLIAIDGTPNKSKLGANAMLGVSMAVARLAARSLDVPLWKYIADRSGGAPALPRLYMNMLNGGAHADFHLPFQEYIVVVEGNSASGAYATAQKIFAALGVVLKREYGDVLGGVPWGDEGGYAPTIAEIEKPFALLREAIGEESETFLAIDAAASEFFSDGKYTLGNTSYSSDELLETYKTLAEHHGLKSIEDPFDENDFPAFERMVREMKSEIIVGDDLTVTNPGIVSAMIARERANALIIKPNQIGTVSETLRTVALAKAAGWKVIASHRSGETDDTFIADLAVGIGAYGLKAGAPTQLERRVKYERLIEIEKEL